MEKQLRCSLLLPLEEIAFRSIIVSLWNEPGILNLFEGDTINGDYEECLFKGQYRVKNRLSDLKLPKTILENHVVSHLISRIGVEIVNWKNYHEKVLSPSGIRLKLGRGILEKLCWTSLGTVNHQNTAKELICCKSLTTFHRIHLALYYCLTDYIPILWEELSEEGKRRFGDILCRYDDSTKNIINYLLVEKIGRQNMPRGSFKNATNFHLVAFEDSTVKGIKAMTEYFCKKLTDDEREILLSKTAKNLASEYFYFNHSKEIINQKLTDVFFYLLSQMRPAQRMKLLKEHPFYVLQFFLQWPWENAFVNAVQLAWEVLPMDDYNRLLRLIYIHESPASQLDLFRKIFLHSPSNFQIFFINEENFVFKHFLYKLFEDGDTETVRFILRNIDASRKNVINYCQNMEDCACYVCTSLTRETKWQFVKLLVREAMPSKLEKKIIMDFSKRYISAKFEEEWELLFQCCDGKRSLEDNKVAKEKKICVEK